MGFTTGLLGGLTLTTALLHLSLSLHARNRVAQSALLHQQSLILHNIVEPAPPLPPAAPREVRAGVFETMKDRWNSELERNVRELQTTDWNGVRDQLEEGASKLWRRAFAKTRESVAEAVK
ncbi:hypothetical protein LTR53_001547 [Teratosphaeriaceae sp. CCFEE 6253]|nr:hypothetical protein LTR53_001547 [Teratosphaeriaceae sp. CCFEE 6253]